MKTDHEFAQYGTDLEPYEIAQTWSIYEPAALYLKRFDPSAQLVRYLVEQAKEKIHREMYENIGKFPPRRGQFREVAGPVRIYVKATYIPGRLRYAVDLIPRKSHQRLLEVEACIPYWSALSV